MQKLISLLISFLMLFFPNSTYLKFRNEKALYTQEMIADTVMTAITERDTEGFEAMICQNIKDNVSDLSEQIATLFQLTEGVTSYSRVGGGATYEGNRGSNRIFKQDVDIRFQNSEINYRLFIVWEVNNFSPAEKGIRHVYLGNKDTQELFVNFKSTEGFLNWHD